MTHRASRMRALALALLLGSALLPSSLAADGPGVVVDDLRFDGDLTAISYHLTGAFDEETVERIHSGLEVSFRHRVELLTPRKWYVFRVLGRRVAASASIETSVSYDAVTERYELFREWKKRSDDERLPEAIRRATMSFDEARAWMTRPEPIELRPAAGVIAADQLLVNIEVVVGRRYLAWIIPAPRTVRERRSLEP